MPGVLSGFSWIALRLDYFPSTLVGQPAVLSVIVILPRFGGRRVHVMMRFAFLCEAYCLRDCLECVH